MATQVETEVIFTEERRSSENGGGENESAAAEKQSAAREKESSPTGEDSGGCFGTRRKNGPKTRKPPTNKWLQQQIPACRPVFTAKHVFALFLVVGIIFIGLGILFVVTTVQLRNVESEYTDCGPLPSDSGRVTNFSSCEDYLQYMAGYSNVVRRDMIDENKTSDCHCIVTFNIEKTIRYPWRFYYGMDNYYQNHRRYLNSWDPSQLRGDDFSSPDSDCRPLTRYSQDNGTGRRPIVPCGLIANSWFNDSFHDLRNEDTDTTFNLSRNNIAWDTDREVRFRNPSDLSDSLRNTYRPPNWLYNLTEIMGGLENESFIVWFRVSAFPWFRKLYARPDNDQDLPPGNYSLLITYDYPVDNFNGRKYIFLTELSWLGGRNLFLGSAYIITGVLCVITSISLLLVHLFLSKWKTSDPNFLRREY